jgi:hypothetical protein
MRIVMVSPIVGNHHEFIRVLRFQDGSQGGSRRRRRSDTRAGDAGSHLNGIHGQANLGRFGRMGEGERWAKGRR